MQVLTTTHRPPVTDGTSCRTIFWAMLMLISCGMNTSIFAQRPISKEHQVQALFLYNFTQFVEWPSIGFSTADAPLIIGILGKDPFGSYIDELVKDEVIKGHPLRVERFTAVRDIGDCHILYINFTDKSETARAIAQLKSAPALTVSDRDGFARMGGMIEFIREEGRIGTRINVAATANSGLVVSSKLLRLSEIVTGKND